MKKSEKKEETAQTVADKVNKETEKIAVRNFPRLKYNPLKISFQG